MNIININASDCKCMHYVLLLILIMYKIISNNNGAFRTKTEIMEHS